MLHLADFLRRRAAAVLLLALAAIGPAPLAAQLQTIDPDTAIDGDLYAPAPATAPASYPRVEATYPADTQPAVTTPYYTDPVVQPAVAEPGSGATWQEDDLVGAAEGVFGKGAQGLAELIRDLLKKQGQPNAYIVGREGGGAFVFGARYGSGTLYHRIEGERPVYWRGPSLGLDAGANAANTFVLVYNLYDGQNLFETYGSGEGQAYLIGGFHVSYLRRGDVVLIPVRMGAGLRLGINVGYMKFSERQRWLPF